MIVKDVTRFARRLDKACKKGKEVIGVDMCYVGSNAGVTIHIGSKTFAKHFDTYNIELVPYSDYPVRATSVVSGITYIALFSEADREKYGIDINGREESDGQS